MSIQRYEVQDHPRISAIVTFTANSTGSRGEVFSIQRNSSGPLQEMPMEQIAEFLNIETGRERDASGSRPIISKEVEDRIVKDLPNHLQEINGRYVYTGPKNENRREHFGSSSYKESIQIYNEQDNLINSANSHLQTQNPGFFTSNEARGVAQNELVIANADSQKPILGTFGAGPCVAIAVYNPTTHSAMLAHIDGLTEISSLKKHLDIIAKNSSEPLQVHLAGGQEESKKMCAEIIEMLNKRGDNTIKSSKLIPFGGSGESLAIDARTGEIFTSFKPKQLDLGTDFDSKSKLLGFQTNNRPINLVSHENKKPKIVKNAEPRIPKDHGLPPQTVTNTSNPSCFSCLLTLKIPPFLKRKSPSTEVSKPQSSKVLIGTIGFNRN
jgi:Protein N-terminal asparagine amidohydrolase